MTYRRTAVASVRATLALSAILACSSGGVVAPEAPVSVTGSGIDYLTTALVHSKQPTATGFIQASTETVELTGDMKGLVLYHVTTVVDTVRATLVNTGDQIFSGTIRGSEPVMLHDDQFRFEVNLATGAEIGHVYLVDHIAGPDVSCTLDVTGTGMNAQGNPTFTYSGACTFGTSRR
jgi:hypothetical protein